MEECQIKNPGSNRKRKLVDEELDFVAGSGAGVRGEDLTEHPSRKKEGMTSILGKSPKMWVNEICVKQLVQPKFETREAFPGKQPPTFICRCTITYKDRVLEAEGCAKTKKDAEQDAAAKMLFDKLEMTNAKLGALLSNSGKSRGGSSDHPPVVKPSTGEGDDEGNVSDTDEEELNASDNPIGELLALCSVNEFEEPEYYEINVEGPAHKRIFTMKCVVKKEDSDQIVVSHTGRRQRKQTAKKLAAFRALREMKELGYRYISFEERNDESPKKEAEKVGTVTLSDKDASLVKDVTNYLENMEVGQQSISRFGIQNVMDLTTGMQGCCNDTTEKCLEYCANYLHVFHHLDRSDTMEELLVKKTPDAAGYSNNYFELLKKVAGELASKLIIRYATDEIAFITIELPPKFHTKVPSKFSLSAHGYCKDVARENAAKEMLKFMITMMGK